jgi:hypothetical protein
MAKLLEPEVRRKRRAHESVRQLAALLVQPFFLARVEYNNRRFTRLIDEASAHKTKTIPRNILKLLSALNMPTYPSPAVMGDESIMVRGTLLWFQV